MKRRGICTILFFMLLLIVFAGCETMDNKLISNKKLYFFDTTRNILVSEALPEEFTKLQDNQEKVKYIITRLKDNKSSVTTTFQAGPEMPIESQGIKDRVVTIHFSEAYNDLTAVEKIGMRASLVYSLAELDFIDGVNFYIEETPLTTATGRLVGTVYPSNINKDILDPNPATIPYTLSVYFANEEGKLVKEEHSVRVSNPNAVEKTILEELIKGPNSDTLSRTVPSDMKVNDARTTNGVCQIDISFDPKSKFFENDRDKELMVYSIVNSLTSEPQIKKVVIFVDGKSDVEFTSDIDFTDTFERSENYISEEEMHS
ncbi:MAG: GerMN domain-containing protein [Candidatus Cellulosilyticum pullistercoris]|uniref:GerMN domain-containing protein n=1 Tax=Candidatus Cellulosilyticum pullistercoris TaxID=2838521 RepID=A0A9E2KB26_9FIRM|nr:GerMN domain-containing protein [Candidatus Cellulosilyticum pullistercoris]